MSFPISSPLCNSFLQLLSENKETHGKAVDPDPKEGYSERYRDRNMCFHYCTFADWICLCHIESLFSATFEVPFGDVDFSNFFIKKFNFKTQSWFFMHLLQMILIHLKPQMLCPQSHCLGKGPGLAWMHLEAASCSTELTCFCKCSPCGDRVICGPIVQL